MNPASLLNLPSAERLVSYRNFFERAVLNILVLGRECRVAWLFRQCNPQSQRNLLHTVPLDIPVVTPIRSKSDRRQKVGAFSASSPSCSLHLKCDNS